MFDDDPATSRAPIGRSIYATLVAFPIACFVLTFLADLAYWATASFIWETAAVWLLTIGLFVAGSAIIGGLIDLARCIRVRGLARPTLVVVGELLAFVLSVVNVFVHSRDGYTAVVPQGLILSGLVVLVLVVTMLVGQATSRTRIGGLA